MSLVPILLLYLSLLCSCSTYQQGEIVELWEDKVGPYNNPSESYPYELLPICELQGAGGRRKDLTIGEALEGHSFVTSPRIRILFGVPQANVTICEITLNEEEANSLKTMVQDNYWLLAYIDDLPVWSFLGELEGKEAKLYTHRTFKFKKNNNQIIEADVEPSRAVVVHPGDHVSLSYSVTWQDTAIHYKNRFHKYLEASFFEHRVHWLSIVNSFMLCIFLMAIVAIILLRTLKNDFAKYAASEAEELESLDKADESGWKQIHGDVFRRPTHLVAFSVLYSCGCHMVALSAITAVLALANSYYAQPGTTISSAVTVYSLCQFMGGYAGGYIFKMYSGKGWRKAMLYQFLFMPTVAGVIFSVLNTTAVFHASSMQVPFRKLLSLFGLLVVVCLPLHVLGTIIGRQRADKVHFPCRLHTLKRPIPEKNAFFMPLLILISGLIPFGCVFIEMYFLFSSFWSYKFYYVYGFVLAVMVLFICVTVCVSIASVYILLNSEDYRWAWLSYMSCACTALYVWLYAVYYYYQSSKMTGFLQFVYYFGTSGFFCLCLALISGAIGYMGASRFVWLIYRNIKSD